MADIKQAAKWMLEGNKVRRNCMPRLSDIGFWTQSIRMRDDGTIQSSTLGNPCVLLVESLLADDWEIAQ